MVCFLDATKRRILNLSLTNKCTVDATKWHQLKEAVSQVNITSQQQQQYQLNNNLHLNIYNSTTSAGRDHMLEDANSLSTECTNTPIAVGQFRSTMTIDNSSFG